MSGDAKKHSRDRRKAAAGLISQPRTSTGRNRALALVAVASAVTLVFFFVVTYRGFHYSDEFEYANVARSLLQGRGATTQTFYPVELGLFAGDRHPMLVHPIGWPIIMAGLFAVFGQAAIAPTIFSAICVWLTVILVFLIGRRLFNEQVGVVAALLALLNPVTLTSASVALSEGLHTLLVTTAIWFLLAAERPQRCVLAGLALGASLWVRESTLLLLPAFFLWAFTAKERRSALAFIGGVTVFVAIFWLRNVLVSGTVLNLYGKWLPYIDTPRFPGIAVLRYPVPPLLDTGGLLRFMATKAFDNIRGFFTVGLSQLGVAVAVGALAFGFQEGRPVEARKAWWLAAGMFVSALAMYVLLDPIARYFAAVLPFLAVFAAGSAKRLLAGFRRTSLTRQVALTLVTAVVLVGFVLTPALVALRDIRAARVQLDFDQVNTFVGSSVAPRTRIISDMPEIVSWGTGLPGIFLPVKQSDLTKMADRYNAPVLVITSERAEWLSGWGIADAGGNVSLPGWREVATKRKGAIQVVVFERQR